MGGRNLKKTPGEKIVEGLLFVVCALLLALIVLALHHAFVADAVDLEVPEQVGELVIPAIPTRRKLPELKPQIDNERKLALKLERWENCKALETVAEPVDDGPEMVYLGQFKITGYDICRQCCGSTSGITASGVPACVGRTCAAPSSIPFGNRLYIDGIGERIVEDRGGFASNVIDVLCGDHPACYAITGTYDVFVMED